MGDSPERVIASQGAVFLSYASQDVEAAQRISAALRAGDRSFPRSERVARRRRLGSEDPARDFQLRAIHSAYLAAHAEPARRLLSPRMESGDRAHASHGPPEAIPGAGCC